MYASGYSGAQDAYRAQAVATASPTTLVTMLYDAALGAIARARAALEAGRTEEIHGELTRAQDIVVELQVSLDREAGGEIAANLATLYDFCLDRLVRANTSKDGALLAAVANTLASLREAWVTAAATLPQETP